MAADLWLTVRKMLVMLLLAIAQAADPKPAVTIAKETDVYSYDFSWSREAQLIAPLDALLRKRAEEDKAEVVEDSTAAKAEAKADGGWFPDTGYMSNWSYATAGQSPALLSLAGEWFTYTGGAHGMFGATSLLWDKSAAKEIEPAHLFERVTEFAMLRPAMCKSLDAERRKKREGESLNTGFETMDDAFNGCPAIDEVTIWIADRDGNGRFDTVHFSAAPYTAGPYAEGQYDMEVPVTSRVIAAVKPTYRDSFEVQPQ